jgi:hypothetical protein
MTELKCGDVSGFTWQSSTAFLPAPPREARTCSEGNDGGYLSKTHSQQQQQNKDIENSQDGHLTASKDKKGTPGSQEYPSHQHIRRSKTVSPNEQNPLSPSTQPAVHHFLLRQSPQRRFPRPSTQARLELWQRRRSPCHARRVLAPRDGARAEREPVGKTEKTRSVGTAVRTKHRINRFNEKHRLHRV